MKALFFILIFIGSIQSTAGYLSSADIKSNISNLADSRQAQYEKILSE